MVPTEKTLSISDPKSPCCFFLAVIFGSKIKLFFWRISRDMIQNYKAALRDWYLSHGDLYICGIEPQLIKLEFIILLPKLKVLLNICWYTGYIWIYSQAIYTDVGWYSILKTSYLPIFLNTILHWIHNKYSWCSYNWCTESYKDPRTHTYSERKFPFSAQFRADTCKEMEDTKLICTTII